MAEKGADMVLRQRAALRAYSQQGALQAQRRAAAAMGAEAVAETAAMGQETEGEVPTATAAAAV